jgi:dihydroorotase
MQKVKTLPHNVVATITPHHLALTIDQAVASTLAFCKPVAKYPSDRAALRSAIREGHPQFFLGSDSAPHPSGNKLPTMSLTITATGEELSLPSPCAAGIYTSPHLIPLLATIFETSQIPLSRLAGFASTFGRDFYGYPAKAGEEVTLKRKIWKVPTAYGYETSSKGKEWIIPFMAEENMGWEIVREERT